MNSVVDSIRSEFLRHKALGEAAIAQLDEGQLHFRPGGEGNSIATLCRHVGGNLRSRFTDFLTTDGEKPWRKRDEEFEDDGRSREQILEQWDRGWAVLFTTLGTLSDADLWETVTIRGQSLLVHEALHRSLAHVSYHTGQIVMLARSAKGDGWSYLSIPPGQSEEYNERPILERSPEGSGSRSADRGRSEGNG